LKQAIAHIKKREAIKKLNKFQGATLIQEIQTLDEVERDKQAIEYLSNRPMGSFIDSFISLFLFVMRDE
jgi:hypothetical protein